VTLAERELVGGECAYWACIPSKTLLRPPESRGEACRAAGLEEPGLHWLELAAYRAWMIRSLDDAKQVAGYREMGVDVHKAIAEIVGPHTLSDRRDHGRIAICDVTLALPQSQHARRTWISFLTACRYFGEWAVKGSNLRPWD